MEGSSTQVVTCIQVNGKTTDITALGNMFFQVVTSMKDISKNTKDADKESLIIKMEAVMKVNGLKTKKKDKENKNGSNPVQ